MKPLHGLSIKSLRDIPPEVRQTGLLAAWIFGLLLAGGLLLLFTQPLRNQAMSRSVNRLLLAEGREIRLGEALTGNALPAKAARLGTWFSLERGPGRAVIFPVISYGAQVPFLGLVSPDGRVESLIPLGNSAARVAERLSPGVRGLYIRRIEAAPPAGRVP
jgi:hypothetical protein